PVQVTTEGAARTVTGAVVDKAGNSKSVTTTTNLDKTPPTLTIASTPPTVSSSQLILTGTVSDTLSGVSRVACNGIAATVSGNGFKCALSLAEGSNSIDVSATDFAGNVSNSLISISLASFVPPPFGGVAVSWINMAGVGAAANNLTKTNGTGAWNSGADSA